METATVKYRTVAKGLPPRRIKLQIPGWSGDNHYGQTPGSKPQPWHCMPFVEGSTYGLELVYPFDTECRVVRTANGKTVFEADFSEEQKDCEIALPPFSTFAEAHYSLACMVDIQTDPDYVMRLEPHPRYYTDDAGDVPLAIGGHLQDWWPDPFFVAFKSPWPGQTHVFRKGEPYAQILILPRKQEYSIVEMTEDEKRIRAARAEVIHSFGHDFIARNKWEDQRGNSFDDKYKVLAKIHSQEGEKGVDECLMRACMKGLAPGAEIESEDRKV